MEALQIAGYIPGANLEIDLEIEVARRTLNGVIF